MPQGLNIIYKIGQLIFWHTANFDKQSTIVNSIKLLFICQYVVSRLKADFVLYRLIIFYSRGSKSKIRAHMGMVIEYIGRILIYRERKRRYILR